MRVTVSVRESVALRIRADSLVSLKSEGLLGDNSVQISVGNIAEDPLGGGGQIPFHESSLLEDVVGAETTRSAAELMAELVGLLRTIRAGDGSIGKLLIEPELYDNHSGANY